MVRGAERFSYPFGLRTTSESRFEIVRAASPSREPVASASVRLAAGQPARGRVRVVPYLGADGRPVGLRVVAIEATSPLAKSGVHRGDAILTADGVAVGDVATFSRRLGEGWCPREVAVVSPERAGAKPVRIEVLP